MSLLQYSLEPDCHGDLDISVTGVRGLSLLSLRVTRPELIVGVRRSKSRWLVTFLTCEAALVVATVQFRARLPRRLGHFCNWGQRLEFVFAACYKAAY